MNKKRTIRLDKFQSPNKDGHYTEQKFYRIYLGNGYIIHLDSLKATLRFIAETNKILNIKVDELLTISTQIYQLWSIQYRLISVPEAIKLQNLLEQFHNSISLALDRSHFANGNYFVFQHLIKSIAALNGCLDQIEKKIRPADASCKTITSTRTQLQAVLLFIELYPDYPFTATLTSQTSNAITIKAPNP